MALPTWITGFFSTAASLHISSQFVKVVGILAGVAFGVFAHDWQTGGEIALGSLAASAGVSQIAIKKSSGIQIDTNATAQVGQPINVKP